MFLNRFCAPFTHHLKVIIVSIAPRQTFYLWKIDISLSSGIHYLWRDCSGRDYIQTDDGKPQEWYKY